MSAPLVATTVAVAETPDLLSVGGDRAGLLWRSETRAIAGVGEALRIDLPGGLADRDGVRRVAGILESIDTRDGLRRPGTGPVAFAALPFDPTAGGHLVVPRTLWGTDLQGSWVTVVGPEGCRPDLPPDGRQGGRPPDRFSLVPSLSHDDWQAVIAEAVDRIRAGALDKVVLARRVDVEANRPFLSADILGRLAALYPSCMVFDIEGFVGASPELLVGRQGTTIESHPLAGTVARSGDAAADDALVAGLFASAKERWEHHLVIDTLSAALRPFCESLEVPDQPAVLGLRNVSHLATFISGRLAADPVTGRVPTALDMVAEVHPTPAVGGTPTKAAIAHLQAVEGFDRGRYAGPVGWVDARGDGAFALGIRSAVLDGARASMYAGVGVVADSDPAAELAETQLKLQALLAAIVRP
ncbi:isochorismate synthase [Acidiferrimicrobium sp. IK]|uniref:isochorismate synthase n=1 Tax=Acidiferrimicrobium sp. IK TaxID=2871700 RepID=UPI0021CB4524|nr:isochorismate synthase [Acidiferrimicrobium sp. IK]MCU4183640.1 isochorismate synthase [Acidiferrimicrobium sp. IK]